MPKHYRPAGKKKEGNAAKKLCILKGVFPREPKKKVKGNHHSYYHLKDIMFLKHEPLLEKLRDMRAYEKKVKKAMSKKNRDLAEWLLTRKPTYTLDMLIKERYPKFIDALRDLDDCLSMVHLFAALPAADRIADGEKIPVSRVHNCRRLSHEWLAYISRSHKLRKTFISVKGIYYQAEVEGQKITWLTPHALQQVLPEVDYRVLLTFLEFYETLLTFVNFRLYHSISVKYPPILDPRLEALAADLYALSRYLDASGQIYSMSSEAITSSGSDQAESELRLAQLQQQLSSNEPGALMNLVEDAAREDEDDLETQQCKNLFKNLKFFLSREAPRESLLFIIPAFGGTVSWEGEGAPFEESDQSITHQVADRSSQGHKFLSREYIQPQWIYDCVNARIILPTEKYTVGCVPPPHLSPFVDNEAEGYVPEYAEAIERLKAAERKEVLPLSGMGKEDLDDPQSLLGIIDRAEAIEAAKKKQKRSMKEKVYHEELKLELEGAQYSAVRSDMVAEVDAAPDLRQMAEDAANMSEVGMSRNKRELLKAIKISEQKKQDSINLIKKRKKKIDEAKSSA
ncbi:pescadillo-like protein [Perilla frutescens var. hirtella]|uniref:Pescadillo homolog n=1 Tax=Perilla frutescens var. hirtella TaxID=608512 RepID=A0AAD4NWT3_PERFH|nr:pescadillo-like protein [Perilla frutescens var. hirtella]